MKKLLLSCLSLISITAFSQNVGIGTTTPANQLEVVGAAPTSTNAVIHSTNNGTTGNAILGISNNLGTYAIRGLGNTGTGVQGYTQGGSAMVGVALSGTAISAESVSGYGLYASGKIKISGGNTTPSDGALLTSDATGNAKWQRSGLAFRAYGAANTDVSHPSTLQKVEFNNEDYDTQNNFAISPGTVTPSSSVFTAPVAGVYHFSIAVVVDYVVAYDNYVPITGGAIHIVQGYLNGVIGRYLGSNGSNGFAHQNASSTISNYVYLNLELDAHLNAGEHVFALIGVQTPHVAPLSTNAYNGSFSGELLFAD